MSNPKVGFVGIGTMGRPMAGWVAKAGYELHIYDTNRDVAAEFAAETGAVAAESVRAVGEACALVITMLPTGGDVRETALGVDGLAERFTAGGVLIDMSSSEPTGTIALAKELEARGVEMIDAPVSGGRAKAVDGTLTLMVGGKNPVIDRCLPVLETMSAKIFRTGGIGSGHASKAINNLLNAVGQLASAETLTIGKRFGLNPDVLLDVINASTGMTHATLNKMRQFVFTRSYDSGFAMDLMLKDMDIALGIARETGTPIPVAEHCREIWGRARQDLGAGQDQMAMTRWVEHQAKADLVPDE